MSPAAQAVKAASRTRLMLFLRRSRSVGSDEWSLMTLSSGQKRLNSVIQELSTERGATIRCGPLTPSSNLRCAKNDIVCSVLPKPLIGCCCCCCLRARIQKPPRRTKRSSQKHARNLCGVIA